ncbi:MAG: formamidopyrimidine-DNA glycosylase, partial [Candidatus Eisenbacteria bacterium]|nr:formamidopyrimidine-DNA glycosylase [Candidatus Eisenbacteria bacterium]
MPEYPDVTVYLECLAPRVLDQPLSEVRILSPFVLRSFEPPIEEARGRNVSGLRRIGKRLVLALDDDLFLVIHLMIAGRLRWRTAGVAVPKKLGLAAFDFPTGSLLLTEAGTKKRASITLVQGENALAAIHRGGIEVMEVGRSEFGEALRRENHTLKRC